MEEAFEEWCARMAEEDPDGLDDFIAAQMRAFDPPPVVDAPVWVPDAECAYTAIWASVGPDGRWPLGAFCLWNPEAVPF